MDGSIKDHYYSWIPAHTMSLVEHKGQLMENWKKKTWEKETECETLVHQAILLSTKNCKDQPELIWKSVISVRCHVFDVIQIIDERGPRFCLGESDLGAWCCEVWKLQEGKWAEAERSPKLQNLKTPPNTSQNLSWLSPSLLVRRLNYGDADRFVVQQIHVMMLVWYSGD